PASGPGHPGAGGPTGDGGKGGPASTGSPAEEREGRLADGGSSSLAATRAPATPVRAIPGQDGRSAVPAGKRRRRRAQYSRGSLLPCARRRAPRQAPPSARPGRAGGG